MTPSRNFRNILKSIDKYPPSVSDAEALIEVLEPFTERKNSYPSYSVIVDYNQTVEQLIKTGKYDWFNVDITSGHFPSKEKDVAEVLVYLVNFNCEIKIEEVIKEIYRLGMRPATLKELLALGAAQPDLQRTDRIIALGSTWGSDSERDVLVPYLDSLSLKSRDLLLYWRRSVPSSSSLFAAVAKRDVLVKK